MIYTKLRSFHAVATTGGFTAAAAILHIGQPTVTSQVKGLEEYYNVELFIRSGRRVELTTSGKQLLALTQRIMSLEADAKDLLQGLGGFKEGHLKIGAVGPYHAIDMLTEFRRSFPNIRQTIMIRNSSEVMKHLLEFNVDVAILAHVHDDHRVISVPYAQHSVVAFVNLNHSWASRESITLHELKEQPLIMREVGSATRHAFMQALGQVGIHVEPVMEIGSREAVSLAVEKGLGVGVVSEKEFNAHPNLKMLKIETEILTYTHVVYLKDREESYMIKAFLDIVSKLKSNSE